MLLFVLKPAVSKDNAELKAELMQILNKVPVKERKMVEPNQTIEKTAKFEAVQDSIDALDFAVQNVDKYYPDMKEHLTTMINSFRDQEHRDSTLALLNKMSENISDPAQKVGAVIYCLERRVFYKSTFADKYDDNITDQTFDEMIKFQEGYSARFNGYYERLEKKVEEQKIRTKKSQEELQKSQEELQKSQEELQKNIQELETNMSKFSPEEVKSNPQLKELVKTTEQRYLENGFAISAHLQSLFDAAK